MCLNDLDIRPELIKFLTAKANKPRRIIEELHVHRGNAIADVVAVHSEAHCYEIKGDNDKIERISKQGIFYNKSFSKITLVTTNKKIEEALKKIPSFWGLILAYTNEGKVKFKHIRATSRNPFFSKEAALSTLWKSEMSVLNQELNLEIPQKVNKREFAFEISEKINKFQANKLIADSLAVRVLYQ